MPIVGERSKFSCLKIYDDTSSSSDGDNGTKLMSKVTPSQVIHLFVRIEMVETDL